MHFIKTKRPLIILIFVSIFLLSCESNEKITKEECFSNIEKCKLIANKGNVNAQNFCGSYFLKEKNEGEAIKWYLLAANSGLTKAQYNLSCIYLSKKSDSYNSQEGIKWLKKAAIQNYGPALNLLAIEYISGDDIKKNEEKGFNMLKEIVNRGTDSISVLKISYFYLAQAYHMGLGTVPNADLAFKYYKLAAESGDDLAQFLLGQMYMMGEGTLKNEESAYKWFKKSSEQGNVDALIKIGYFYLNGIYVKKDYEQGLKIYKQASDKGAIFNTYYLAQIYYFGLYGQKRDKGEALKWGQKAYIMLEKKRQNGEKFLATGDNINKLLTSLKYMFPELKKFLLKYEEE